MRQRQQLHLPDDQKEVFFRNGRGVGVSYFSHLFHRVTSSCQKLNLISGDLTHGDHTDTSVKNTLFRRRRFIFVRLFCFGDFFQRKKKAKRGITARSKVMMRCCCSTSSRCRILPTFDTGKWSVFWGVRNSLLASGCQNRSTPSDDFPTQGKTGNKSLGIL